MAFALIAEGAVTDYPVTAIQVRRRFPNTSFPQNMEGADLSDFGVAVVAEADKPSFDVATQRIEEATPTLVDGTWTQAWSVVDLDATETQKVTDSAAASVREERNLKLAACDWTVLADSPLSTSKKTEWKTYRTALRDISSASGFPHTMEWPTEPS